ncbi:xanthine dehydrogenase accessory factor [Rhizobium leguminosarum]|uniref:Xanthine dehydrogenase accessory factor n=1 Tax=Rhizobium leguminosarum TaxID=384 RepID=A0AAE2MLE6_RHILE|nr:MULTISPECIES: XdhC family protein [Rhizobium]MBB4291467.1 xanthine dehydrogenase accessory factor [Rhizobium leguminosarum]MBB4296164.1 xanthine dehydrogenase accessory factor [Rhizobium leguminosarum]MBB4308577.1 xanthine dehydrogenase accessory factor [Rhizobium leguminosarum]MBB4416412.1 xanthine dehydrogenase accessory factor [Rhizobium leguminosarum]MBB4430621.1 xanthine dehydrogenase accessory factor [Rhizobium esperanzae]
MDAANLARLNDARRGRRAAILLTDLETGDDSVVFEGYSGPPSFEPAIDAAFRSGKSTSVEVDGHPYFLNVHLPPARIVIIGAVHISQILAQMASLVGFDVRIIDPRTAFATPERFPGIDLTGDWPVDVLKDRPLDAYTALVAVTHDPKIDDFPISEALRSGCFYVGALGSRKTQAARLERLRVDGVDEARLARISGPIGLDIGAASPAEIAVAILAEIIHTLRTREISPIGDK